MDAIPGVLAYGVSRTDAVARVQALALRALAERMEQGEVVPELLADGIEWFPRIVGGERAGPPEDVGGMLGYADFLAALKDPTHPEHVERREWAPPGFDPERFDRAAAEHALTLVCAWGAI